MAEKSLFCFECSHETKVLDHLGFREECSQCGADLHVCKNCEFYDPGSYNECRESSADPIKEKERANFCDFFRMNENQKTKSNEKEAQLSAAEALFKK